MRKEGVLLEPWMEKHQVIGSCTCYSIIDHQKFIIFNMNNKQDERERLIQYIYIL